MLNPTVIAIPLFALMIGIEAWFARRSHPDYYETKDAWNNIFIGFVSVAFGALLYALFVGFIYQFAYDIAPYKFPVDAWWSWVILFFVDDFAEIFDRLRARDFAAIDEEGRRSARAQRLRQRLVF